jgi:hypothetical protein
MLFQIEGLNASFNHLICRFQSSFQGEFVLGLGIKKGGICHGLRSREN